MTSLLLTTRLSDTPEHFVQDICRDIKALDVAKKHLTTTIETLNRLQMLVTSVHRLEQYVEAHEYIDAGRLLEAVQQLFKLFAEYHGVPTMRNLMERVDAVKVELQQLIEDDFDELTEAGAGEAHSLGDSDSDGGDTGHSAAVATSLETLKHACAVIDALGGRLLERLIARFCRKQLNRPYERTFGGQDACNLEAVERRYAWFRRTLRDIEARFGRVLPEHWCLPHRLTVAFADKARADIAGRILAEFDPPSSAPAELLVRALNKTLQFEKEMQKRFEKEGSVAKGGADGAAGGGSDAQHGGSAAGGNEEAFDESAPLINEDGDVVDPSTAEGIRLKYRRRKEWEAQQQEKASNKQAKHSKDSWLHSLADGKGAHQAPTDGQDGKEMPELPGLLRRISDAFDPYMGAYIRLERDSLEMIVGDAKVEVQSALQTDEEGVEGGAAATGPHAIGDRDVLASSSKLFQQIKNATSRCVQLSTGNTFFELYIQFKEVLQTYASALETGLPAAAPAKTPTALRFSLGGGSSSTLPGDTFGLKADAHGLNVLRSVARIVNTAEYVAETLQGLEDTLRSKIDDSFGESVSFADAQDAFYALSALATKVLGEVTAGMLDQPLTAMVTTNWWALTEVGDASAYVSELDSCLRAAMPTVRVALIDHPGAFRAFCDKFVRAFTARYMACLYLCQRIGEMGAQQLLLDAQGIRSILLDAPVMEAVDGSGDELPVAPLPTVYKNFVSREVPRAEMLLKLLATPEARFAASIKALWTGATAAELQRVMQLRNMSRRVQATVLAELGLGEGSSTGGDIMGSMGSLLGRRGSTTTGK